MKILFVAPRAFVASGPYRYTRNPMYVGAFAILAGVGLYLRSPSVALFSFAWLLLFHLVVVLIEEPDLTRKFGTSYEEYCRARAALVPTPAARVQTGGNDEYQSACVVGLPVGRLYGGHPRHGRSQARFER